MHVCKYADMHALMCMGCLLNCLWFLALESGTLVGGKPTFLAWSFELIETFALLLCYF